jgi:hypothetical protein
VNKRIKRKDASARLNSFSLKKFAVDKLHIKGHKDAWCRQNVDPILYPILTDVNTVICEQINFWLGRFKHAMKHMNVDKYNFFLYIILNELNKIKCNGRFNILHTQNFEECVSRKRKADDQ